MQDQTLGRQASQMREMLLVLAPAVVLIVTAFWLAFQFVEPAPPRKLVMTTGGEAGGYFAFGKLYAALLKESGIELEVRTSAGSVENLARLTDPAQIVEIGLLQGGIGTAAVAPDLVSLGRVFLEPVWIFYRGDNKGARLGELAGQRIVVGAPGSGTRALAETLLMANGVTAANASLLPLGTEPGVAALISGAADAVVLVVAAEAPVITRLLATPGIALMSLDQADAYTRKFPYLSKVTVPMGMIDLARNLPPKDVAMVAAEAALVARGSLHPALVGVLVEAAQRVHRPAGAFQRFGDFPKASDPDFPLSDDAERIYKSGPPFLQRYLPFWLATFLERMAVMVLPIATILLPLIKVVPMIYDWRIRSRILHWYGQLKRLEKAMAADRDLARVGLYLIEIKRIEDGIAVIPVPLLYSADFYDLKGAVDLVEQKLGNRRAAAAQAEQATPSAVIGPTTA